MRLIQRHRIHGYFTPDFILPKMDEPPSLENLAQLNNSLMCVRFPNVWEFQVTFNKRKK